MPRLVAFFAVNADVQFGLVEFQVDIDVLERWIFLNFVQKRRQLFAQFLEIQVLNHKLNRLTTAPATWIV